MGLLDQAFAAQLLASLVFAAQLLASQASAVRQWAARPLDSKLNYSP